MTSFAIIIPAYNEETCLAATMAAAREAMKEVEPVGELIVVNNNSSDGTAEVARSEGADQVVFEPHNQIARARNAGAAATDAEHLLFVDADTCLNVETLRTALSFLQSGSVAAGGARIEVDQEVSVMVGFLVASWNRTAAFFKYAAGSFFFCRRDVFQECGGFDETVYAGEEVWFARRIKKWARAREMTFEVISDSPVVTSGRKSDWYSNFDFIRQLAVIFLIPWSTRSKRFCSMWYSRPGDSSESQP